MTTEAAGLGLTGVLARALFAAQHPQYGPDGIEGAPQWWQEHCAEQAAHVAEEVRTWLRAALTSPEVVEAVARTRYAYPKSKAWESMSSVVQASFLAQARTGLDSAAEILGGGHADGEPCADFGSHPRGAHEAEARRRRDG